MSLAFWKTNPFIKSLIQRIWLWDARQKVEKIAPFLNHQDKILEVGTGLGTVSYSLMQQGYQIQGLDVGDYRFFPEVEVHIYDGEQFPFEKNEFDTVLILTVLHHIPHPEKILEEAARVGKKIIIIEDIYANIFQKYLTFMVDSIVNWEFKGHPHSNKTDRAWKMTFRNLNLSLARTYSYRFAVFFRQVVYYLESHPKRTD